MIKKEKFTIGEICTSNYQYHKEVKITSVHNRDFDNIWFIL